MKTNWRISFPLPLVGGVPAGFPFPVDEELRDHISLEEFLVTRPEASFLVEVSGDSMIGEGIMPGDLLIVEKGRKPKNGDVILAQVDGERTIKYFTKWSGKVVMEAANEKYPPIQPRDKLCIGGIVTAVIRKYHR
jgi:repressor LexA